MQIIKINLLILITFLLHGCGAEENFSESQKLKVDVVKVQQGDFPLLIDAVGTAVANQVVNIISRIDSTVMAIKFNDGDYVQKGKVLFYLDDRQLKAQLAQNQANLLLQKAQLHYADIELKRGMPLVKKGFISKQQYDLLQTNYESAQANVEATKAAIEDIRVQLTYTVIQAPISGRTGTINITEGNTVKAVDASTNALVTINQISPIRIQVPISQRFFGQLKKEEGREQAKALILGADRKPIERALILYNENEIDQNTRNISIWALAQNKKEVLWPGMFVDVILKLGTLKNVLIVPLSAVQNSQAGQIVFMVREGKIYITKVSMLHSYLGRAAISGQIKKGDEIVVGGFLKLKEGLEVSPQLLQNVKEE